MKSKCKQTSLTPFNFANFLGALLYFDYWCIMKTALSLNNACHTYAYWQAGTNGIWIPAWLLYEKLQWKILHLLVWFVSSCTAPSLARGHIWCRSIVAAPVVSKGAHPRLAAPLRAPPPPLLRLLLRPRRPRSLPRLQPLRLLQESIIAHKYPQVTISDLFSVCIDAKARKMRYERNCKIQLFVLRICMYSIEF